MGARSSKITAQNNRSDGHLLEYFRNTFVRGGGANAGPTAAPQGLTATGGVISDYTDGSTVYRAHIFTSSGTFNVSALGSFGSTVDYLVVGGGAGGGSHQGGGGGAGGYRTSMPEGPGGPSPTAESQLTVSTSPGSYTVTIGAGGARTVGPIRGIRGTPTVFGSITSHGGGGGGVYGNSGGLSGASGGGAGADAPTSPVGGGPGNIDPGGNPVTNQGYPGGGAAGSSSNHRAGGGGGAGAAGTAGVPGSYSGPGGIGKSSVIAYGPTNPQNYAGGGGGSCEPATQSVAGNQPGNPGGLGGAPYGAGAGGYGGTPGTNATYSTGSGGGGNAPSPGIAGSGGSGIVVVRYQIAQLTATAKATGGVISYYNNKTIHTFTSSGTFTAPGSFSETVEYVVVGGGGGSGAGSGGGGAGGAGAYRTASIPLSGPQAISVQIGAGGRAGNAPSLQPSGGTPSYFGTPITAPGGGEGGIYNPGATGGSGGGAGSTGGTTYNGGPATGAPFPGTIGTTPSAGWGHPGGGSTGNANYGVGGGGGAGGAGATGTTTASGPGGSAIQLPTTFRDPKSTVGAPGPTSSPFTGTDNSGKYWVAGGGGGGAILQGTTPGTGGGGGATNGASTSASATPAEQNTGSGAGGGSNSPNPLYGGNGGSGIVLIAYPS